MFCFVFSMACEDSKDSRHEKVTEEILKTTTGGIEWAGNFLQ